MDRLLGFFRRSTNCSKTITYVVALLKLPGFDLANSWRFKRTPLNLSPKTVNLELDKLPIERLSGVSWDPNSDILIFKILNKNIRETKRGILSMISSIFGSMGLISAIIVKAKFLIQEIWRRSLGRDEESPRYLIDQWNLWKNSVLKLSSITVPWWVNFKSTETQKLEIDIFADASSKAYGASAFISVKNTSLKYCNLVCKIKNLINEKQTYSHT